MPPLRVVSRTRRSPTPPKSPPLPAPIHPFDRRFSTETGGLIPRAQLATGSTSDRHVTAYYAVAPSILDATLDLWLGTQPALPIGRYTFLDVGAGKGRALLAAACHPFAQAVGVELNPALAAIARANAAVFRTSAADQLLAPITLVEGDILTVPLPAEPTLAFLFHPFEAPLLRRFLARTAQHFTALAQPFDLVYVNSEHGSELDRNPAFTRLFHGLVPMSTEDHLADLAEIALQTEYGSTGDELCSLYRLRPNHI